MHQILSTYPRFAQVRDEVIELQQRLQLNQLSVQIAECFSGDWEQSTGWLLKPKTELMFDTIHPELVGSELEKYIQWLPFPVFRTRIMVMVPGRQYTTHKDPTRRLHLPIVTNESARFLFPDDGIEFHMIGDGAVHAVDTRNSHTAVNNGQENRIHVVSVIPNDVELSQF
jgi:hypothetical protein